MMAPPRDQYTNAHRVAGMAGMLSVALPLTFLVGAWREGSAFNIGRGVLVTSTSLAIGVALAFLRTAIPANGKRSRFTNWSWPVIGVAIAVGATVESEAVPWIFGYVLGASTGWVVMSIILEMRKEAN